MGFLERESTGSSNPTKHFLEWKGGNGQGFFQYWDKESEQNVQVPAPLKFVVLEEYATIKGWSDSEQSGIYSNEVLKTTTEELTVRTFSGKKIASGLYKEIKTNVNNAGGKFTRSIYIVTSDFELYNLQLKGAALKAWGDFTKENYKALKTNWVEYTGKTEGKKGAIKFFTPDFKLSDAISSDDYPKVSEVATTFSDYIKGYMGNDQSEPQTDEHQARREAEEEVPF